MMNNSDAPKPAAIHVVRDGMSIFRHDARTHTLVGSMIYSEWDGKYGVTDAKGRTRRVERRDIACAWMVAGIPA